MILYFVTTLIATLIGSVAGMGGGVIIKPVLDLIGDYDIVTISMLSSLTVVSMALTATVKQMRSGFLVTKPMIAVTAGAVIGGTLGGVIFSIAKAGMNPNTVTVVQSAILIALMVFCLFYQQLPTKHVHSAFGQGLVGMLLGVLGTFLGIGGGPINVAALVLIMGIGIRDAAKISVFVILFAQAFGLITKAFNGQYQMVQDYRMLLVMIPAAVIGGLAGSVLNIRLKEKQIHRIYIAVVFAVMIICGYNIYSNISI